MKANHIRIFDPVINDRHTMCKILGPMLSTDTGYVSKKYISWLYEYESIPRMHVQ